MSETNVRVAELIDEMRDIQENFLANYGVNDIFSNSKIFEVLQANKFGHSLIPGHSGSLDASDADAREYEYKHYKESSSNHSWTFNDYSELTITKLRDHTHAVVFTHIDDTVFPPEVDWSYEVSGPIVSDYLAKHTLDIKNARRMINISAKQLSERIGASVTPHVGGMDENGPYAKELVRIFSVVAELELLVGVKNILTSNKFWEVLVSIPLGHTVNSEQGGRAGAHDAFDDQGRDYEYKVSSSKSWNFQDISDAVLNKYLNCESIILAVVNKPMIEVTSIWSAEPALVVQALKLKRDTKAADYAAHGKEVRRQQVSLSAGDLAIIRARQIV